MTNLVPLALAATLMITGCSKPEEYQLPERVEDWKSDEGLKKNVEKLEKEDKELLRGFLVRAAMSEAFGGDGAGKMTIGEAIENQKSWQAEQAAKKAVQEKREAEANALAEKLAKQKKEAEDKMNAALTVALTKLEWYPADYRNRIISDGFNIEVGMENKTGVEITAVKGSLRLADSFDDEIKTLNFSSDVTIPPGEAVTWKGGIDYNQFMNEDQKLKSTAFNKLKVTWHPAAYIFADGSKMELPE